MNKEERLLKVINTMIQLCEPIKYSEFNKKIKAINRDELLKAEKEESTLGVSNFNKKNETGISTLSIIATITDILIGKRLAFKLEKDGIITGVEYYKE